MVKLRTNKRLLLIFSIVLISLVSCNEKIHDKPPPMVDGNIKDFVELGISPIKLDPNVNLYMYQNQHYVWFGYTYPARSYGLLDLEIVTPSAPDTLKIHVSAQLGEWPSNRPDLIPQSPESDLWWNMDGWIANEVWLNGMERTGETPKYRFKNGTAREIQMDKNRFGRGIWEISLHITNIMGKNNEDYSILFPSDSTFYKLKVN